jgi:hypothetical protein
MDRLHISIPVYHRNYLSVKKKISAPRISSIYMAIAMNKKTIPLVKKEHLEAIRCIIQEF